ncbi:MAG: HlyD family type I secretion periplasmic adaptor subunit [Roseovarius sp.]
MTSGTLSVRAPLALGLVTLIVLLGGFGSWATQTKIAGAIVVPGRIVVERHRQVVAHPDGGVVAEIAVEEGAHVAQGTLLLRLESGELASRLSIVENTLFSLMARRGRLEAERDGREEIRFDPLLIEASTAEPALARMLDEQRRLHQARRTSAARELRQLEKRREQVRAQLVGLAAQAAALDTQARLIGQELADQQSLLERGLAQAPRVLALEREAARLAGQAGELQAARAQAEGRITELEIDSLKIAAHMREEAMAEISQQSHRELELSEERRALTARLSRLEIRAPVAGTVLGLAVSGPRAVIRPAEPVLHLVPEDRALVVAAEVDPMDVDKLYPGQPALLRLPGLDLRKTPELPGTVRWISADVFSDSATRRSFYRVELELAVAARETLPPGARLMPGMPVEALIRTKDHTPLAYFSKPLTDYFARAFR